MSEYYEEAIFEDSETAMSDTGEAAMSEGDKEALPEKAETENPEVVFRKLLGMYLHTCIPCTWYVIAYLLENF